LPALIGFAALAIDLGHGALVDSQLQHGADASALAGVTPLLGTRFADPIGAGRTRAFTIATQNVANGQPIAASSQPSSFSLNPSNDPNGDIVSGIWNWTTRTFTPSTDPTRANAMQVRTARDAAHQTPVATYLAQFLGINQFDVRTSAIAAAGGPACASAFPIALPLCGITDANGQPLCNGQTLVFRNDTLDNAGLTSLTNGSANTQTYRDILNNYNPNAACTASAGTNISLSNGTQINALRNALDPWLNRTVYMPVLDTSAFPGCAVKYNQSMPVAGFTAFVITSIIYTGANQSITGHLVCNSTAPGASGTPFIGLGGRPRLVQ
jgi:hypothetical protein